MARVIGPASGIALLVASAGSCFASEPTEPIEHRRQWYVSAFGGWSDARSREFDFVDDLNGSRFQYQASLEDGYVAGAAAGLAVSRNARVELEIAHSVNDFGQNYRSIDGFFVGQNVTGSQKVTTVMANVWLNANLAWASPYIGGGIGWGHAEGALTVSNGAGAQFSGSDSGLAYQFGLGVRIPISSHFEFDLGYRVRTVQDIAFSSSIPDFSATSDNITTRAVQLGMNVKF